MEFLLGASTAMFFTSLVIGLWSHFSSDTDGWGIVLCFSAIIMIASIIAIIATEN